VPKTKADPVNPVSEQSEQNASPVPGGVDRWVNQDALIFLAKK